MNQKTRGKKQARKRVEREQIVAEQQAQMIKLAEVIVTFIDGSEGRYEDVLMIPGVDLVQIVEHTDARVLIPMRNVVTMTLVPSKIETARTMPSDLTAE